VALQLKRQGITRVHPLEGGLLGWMALGFPVEDRRPSDGDQILPLKLVDARTEMHPVFSGSGSFAIPSQECAPECSQSDL